MAHDDALAQDFPVTGSRKPAGVHMTYPGESLVDGTPGDFIKQNYKAGMRKGVGGVYEKVRDVGLSGFGKGVAIAALAVMAVMAVVAGYMGANSGLEVGGMPVTTFEDGIAQGLSKGAEFLTSSFGLVTMAIGGLIGLGSDVLSNQRKIAAQETERLALEYKREHAKQKTIQKEAAPVAPTTEHTHKHEHTHEHKPEAKAEKAHGGLDENGIYVKGSEIYKAHFCAAELKRRTERETHTHVGMAG